LNTDGNPSSVREEDFDPGPPDDKSSALTTRPRRLLNIIPLSPPSTCASTGKQKKKKTKKLKTPSTLTRLENAALLTATCKATFDTRKRIAETLFKREESENIGFAL